MWLRPRGSTALAAALVACRQHAGLTQQVLAGRLRIDRTTLLDMEAGRNRALTRWAEAMSVLGYDVVVVPRGAKVTVEDPPSAAQVDSEASG